ncbi:MAG: hypothetical protein J2P25_21500 [Nocardiopsaceae bacterium]|nr:hypothetical protein [Nocardiopsaceae bacterium]
MAASVIGLAACGGGSPAGRVNAIDSAAASARAAGQPGAITSAKLVGALLTKINGAPATGSAADGSYESLPQVKTAERQARSVHVRPGRCRRAELDGPQLGALGHVPAAAVNFTVGRNSVSEMLAAPPRSAAEAELSRTLPASCERYWASSGGKDAWYTAKEESVAGIGQRARVLNVRPDSQPSGNTWSVVFRGAGFVGSVTVVGPDASELAVRELGLQAYGFAARTLS